MRRLPPALRPLLSVARHAAAACLLVTLGGACSEAERRPLAATGAPAALEPVVEVPTAAIVRGSVSRVISAPGSLVALRESRIGAEVRGRLERVHVDEGDRVEKGDPLFEIDAAPYRLGLRQARAGLDLARAERRQRASDLARAEGLRSQDIVAQQKIDSLKTLLAVARAREQQAAEVVALAELELERTRVVAPYAGSIAMRLADEGTTALVQPQTVVVVLQETAELEARATIPEVHLATVALGDRALLLVEGLPDPIETTVMAVSDAVDPATRTYLVRMRVPNADHRLKAGVFAHVELRPQPRTDVLLVPRAAIRSEAGRNRVLAVRDGRAVAVPVELGIVESEAAEVLSGLREGERVVVGDEAQTIAPGMRVRERGEPAEAS